MDIFDKRCLTNLKIDIYIKKKKMKKKNTFIIFESYQLY